MIMHKMWKARRKTKSGHVTDTWMREGWFLFGLLPLYVRDCQNRERF